MLLSAVMGRYKYIAKPRERNDTMFPFAEITDTEHEGVRVE